MPGITEAQIRKYVEAHISEFHDRRLESLQGLKLTKVLKRKNPYLFRAKNVLAAGELVQVLLDAHLSSQEEGVFGDFLEGLALFICGRVFGGQKSSAEGIDLEFTRDGVRYIVTIKSGPNWGNSSQIKKMKDHFRQAKRVLRTSRSKIKVEAVNGCCYGTDRAPDKGEYLKYCGQRFWEFVSDKPNLYIDIIAPLGHQAKEKNDAFNVEYAKTVNRFTREFIEQFCEPDGSIRWEDVLRFNSGVKGTGDPASGVAQSNSSSG